MKIFMLSYLSDLTANSHQIHVQKIKADTDEMAFGILMARAVPYATWEHHRLEPDYEGWPEPLAPDGVVIVELTEALAEEIMAESL